MLNMSLRINNQGNINQIMANLRKANESLSSELGRMSSGKRIEKAADDTAGLSMGTKIEAFVRSQRQAIRNGNDGVSFVQTAEGGLTEISNILTRMRELTIQAGSDTVGENERGFLDKEYQALLTEIDRIAEATSFNGTNVINGDGKGELNFHVGSFRGEENVITFDTDGTYSDTSRLGVRGTGILDKFEALDSVQSIDQAIENLSGQRAVLGALQSRLQYAVANLDVSVLNHEKMRSVIEDLDVAESSAKIATENIRKNAAEASLAHATNIPKSALKLIS
ncbi:MAG: flagellin Hag [Bdellovibrio sp.]